MRGAFWLIRRIESKHFATIAVWSARSITATEEGCAIRTWLTVVGTTTSDGAITVTSGAGVYIAERFRDTEIRAQDQGLCTGMARDCMDLEVWQPATGAWWEGSADARPAGPQPE
jgi:hypothetical protein